MRQNMSKQIVDKLNVKSNRSSFKCSLNNKSKQALEKIHLHFELCFYIFELSLAKSVGFFIERIYGSRNNWLRLFRVWHAQFTNNVFKN